MAKKRLDVLLVEKGLLESRNIAQRLIMAGKVEVEGVRRDKPGWQVEEDADITVKSGPQFVSRAGMKLASVAEKFNLDFKDKKVLDVGSSTGGFSDFALQQGAERVYAVDVGTHQLHERIRGNPRVVVMERTDIRDANLPEAVDIVLIDVSFISLREVLPHVKQFLHQESLAVAMCKPQFEAGVKDASKHKGVIKNDTLRRRILKSFEQWLIGNSYAVIDKADSKLSGAKGNIERFYLLKSQ